LISQTSFSSPSINWCKRSAVLHGIGTEQNPRGPAPPPSYSETSPCGELCRLNTRSYHLHLFRELVDVGSYVF
jgi:hypothetical protein